MTLLSKHKNTAQNGKTRNDKKQTRYKVVKHRKCEGIVEEGN